MISNLTPPGDAVQGRRQGGGGTNTGRTGGHRAKRRRARAPLFLAPGRARGSSYGTFRARMHGRGVRQPPGRRTGCSTTSNSKEPLPTGDLNGVVSQPGTTYSGALTRSNAQAATSTTTGSSYWHFVTL